MHVTNQPSYPTSQAIFGRTAIPHLDDSNALFTPPSSYRLFSPREYNPLRCPAKKQHWNTEVSPAGLSMPMRAVLFSLPLLILNPFEA